MEGEQIYFVKKPMKRVVVTGMGCVNSIASNIEEFVQALKDGKCGVKEITLFNTEGYRTKLAAQISDNDYKALFSDKDKDELRVVNFTLKACEEAMEASKLTELNSNRTGVSLATSLGCIDGIDRYLSGQKTGKVVSNECYFDTCARICQIVNDKYEINGPVYTVSTACAAGTNSIGIAFDEIRYNRADVMICGGIDPISRISINGFNALKSLSASGYVRSFSKERDGLIIGEGSGILILEEYDHAVARGANIIAEVVGYAISNDAYHMTTPDPKGGGAIRSIRNCIEDAGICVDDIDYINAHGTGTNYNDVMELIAISNILGKDHKNLCISSIKGMVGHMLGAAGSIECISTILSLKYQFIPPTINFLTAIDGYQDYEYAANECKDYKIDYAISNSFAFAGNCASIMLKRYEE